MRRFFDALMVFAYQSLLNEIIRTNVLVVKRTAD
nr:MAG TPA: hypothetical protein [Caudoviricetes sp.]